MVTQRMVKNKESLISKISLHVSFESTCNRFSSSAFLDPSKLALALILIILTEDVGAT